MQLTTGSVIAICVTLLALVFGTMMYRNPERGLAMFASRWRIDGRPTRPTPSTYTSARRRANRSL
jgi:hypothetical protein